MDPSSLSPQHSTENMSTQALRHLPTYEEATVPYSLRLPTYRSSYIRRFHPYARYTDITPSPQEFDSDDLDYYDDDTLLDLSILGEYVPQQPDVPLALVNEFPAISTPAEVEDLAETEASVANNPDDVVGLEGPRGAFLRINTITSTEG